MADWLPERLPEDVEAERSLLATLSAPGAEVIASEIVFQLTEEDFVHPSHRAVFKALRELLQAQLEVNALTLKDTLDLAGELTKVGGYPGLVDLLGAEQVGRPQVLADLLVRKRKQRSLIRLGAQLVRQAAEEEAPPETLVERAAVDLFRLAQGHDRKGLEHVGDVARDTMEALLDRLEGRGSTGLRVGFPRLDAITQGFQPGNLIILAARPGIGKTALALNWLLRAAKLHKAHGALFSLEMSKEEVFSRLLSAHSRVNMKAVQAGAFDDQVQARLLASRDELMELPVFVNDRAAITVREITAMVDRHLANANQRLDMLIVDYLQLLSSPEDSRAARQSEAVRIGEISRAFKLLAKDHSIPVVVLSQLNREVEHRQGGRPQLSDLRDCVTGDTAVLLADGRRALVRDLVDQEPEVWSMDSAGRLLRARAEKIWRVGLRSTKILRLASGRDLTCTERHRVWTQRGWVQAGELETGDRIALARKLPEAASTLQWDNLKVALLGQLIGDGSYLPHQPLRYTTASEENSQLVREAAERCFGAVVNRHAGRGAWHQLVISGNGNRWHPKGLGLWLRELGIFGQRGYEKRIPQDAFKLGKAQTGLLLKHLWATDGTISLGKDDRRLVHFSTSSRHLALDVSTLLLKLGIVTRIQTVESRGARPTHMVWITGAENQRIFLREVGAFGPREEAARRLDAALEGVQPNTNVDTLPRETFQVIRGAMKRQGITTREMSSLRGAAYNGTAAYHFAPSRELTQVYAEILHDEDLVRAASSDLFWDRLVLIEDGPTEDVFDLTVPGPASWLADGIVSHNSGAIEQDADIVCFIHRKMKPVADGQDEDRSAELIVAKHRNGPTGVVPLYFEGEYATFREMERYTDEG